MLLAAGSGARTEGSEPCSCVRPARAKAEGISGFSGNESNRDGVKSFAMRPLQTLLVFVELKSQAPGPRGTQGQERQ